MTARDPLAAAALAPTEGVIWHVVGVTLLALVGLGALEAEAGGAPRAPGTLRVLFWGVAATAITAGVGRLFGVSI